MQTGTLVGAAGSARDQTQSPAEMNVMDQLMDASIRLYHSIHVKLSRTSSSIAARCIHDSGWNLLGDEFELFLELCSLRNAARSSKSDLGQLPRGEQHLRPLQNVRTGA